MLAYHLPCQYHGGCLCHLSLRTCMHGVQGGSTWDNATLRGLPDTAPDCEGSMASSLITRKDPTDGKLYNTTCFYVSSPVRSLR